MGRYDGILLLTDFDGTLYTGREIPQRNIEAIRRFCAEGGKFGFSSGRTQGFFKEWEDVVRSNTCISAINGTLIYDYPRGEIVSEKFLPDGAFDKALRVCLEFEDYYNIAVFRRDLVDALDFGSDGLRDALRAMMSGPVYKVMFHSRHDITDSEKRAIEEIFGVTVIKVTTLHVRSKAKRQGAYPMGKTASWKKAVVKLSADSKNIELFEGMV